MLFISFEDLIIFEFYFSTRNINKADYIATLFYCQKSEHFLTLNSS